MQTRFASVIARKNGLVLVWTRDISRTQRRGGVVWNPDQVYEIYQAGTNNRLGYFSHLNQAQDRFAALAL